MQSAKNRLCKDEQKAQMFLSFTNGPNRYYGLLEDAIEADIIEQVNSKNFIIKETEEKVRVNKLYNGKVFTQERLDVINEHCKGKYLYATVTHDEDAFEDTTEEPTD